MPDAPCRLDLSALDQPDMFLGGAGTTLTVAIDKLQEDPLDARTESTPDEIDEVAHDIAQRGMLQPIVVRPANVVGRYIILFGSTRWCAARQAELTEVPAVVDTKARDVYDQVAESPKRHALSAMDLSRFIGGRTEAGDSNAAIAERLGIDINTVAYHLALAVRGCSVASWTRYCIGLARPIPALWKSTSWPRRGSALPAW